MDANLINSLLNDVNEALKTAKDKLKQINSDGSIETYEKLCSEMFTSEFQIRIPTNLFENIINPEKFTCALNATIELKKLYKRGQMAVKNRLLKKLKIPRNPFLPRSVAYRKLDINDNESTAQHTDCLELDDASLEDEINQQLLQLSNDKVQEISANETSSTVSDSSVKTSGEVLSTVALSSDSNEMCYFSDHYKRDVQLNSSNDSEINILLTVSKSPAENLFTLKMDEIVDDEFDLEQFVLQSADDILILQNNRCNNNNILLHDSSFTSDWPTLSNREFFFSHDIETDHFKCFEEGFKDEFINRDMLITVKQEENCKLLLPETRPISPAEINDSTPRKILKACRKLKTNEAEEFSVLLPYVSDEISAPCSSIVSTVETETNVSDAETKEFSVFLPYVSDEIGAPCSPTVKTEINVSDGETNDSLITAVYNSIQEQCKTDFCDNEDQLLELPIVSPSQNYNFNFIIENKIPKTYSATENTTLTSDICTENKNFDHSAQISSLTSLINETNNNGSFVFDTPCKTIEDQVVSTSDVCVETNEAASCDIKPAKQLLDIPYVSNVIGHRPLLSLPLPENENFDTFKFTLQEKTDDVSERKILTAQRKTNENLQVVPDLQENEPKIPQLVPTECNNNDEPQSLTAKRPLLPQPEPEIPPKRLKTEEETAIPTPDDPDEIRDLTNVKWNKIKKLRDPFEFFEFVKDQWRSKQTPYPHQNLGCRFVKQPHAPGKHLFKCDHNPHHKSIMSVFDGQISVMSNSLTRIRSEIVALESGALRIPLNARQTRLCHLVNCRNRLNNSLDKVQRARRTMVGLYNLYWDSKTGLDGMFVSEFMYAEVDYNKKLVDGFANFYSCAK